MRLTSRLLKIAASFAFIFLLQFSCVAQGKFQWLKNPASFGDEMGFAVFVDKFGSVYTGGSFSDTLIFANQTFISRGGAVGSEGIILKYDSAGNEIWARVISSFHTGSSNHCVGIEGDSSGNIFVLGGFTDTAHFGPFVLSAVASIDGFLTKLDSGGNFQWVFHMAGQTFDYPQDLKVSAAGKTYVTGSYAYSLAFGSIALSGYVDKDVFTGKIDENGQALWVQRAGSHGVGDKHDNGAAIELDRQENCYVTGMFKDTSEFGAIQLISRADMDIFIAKYDSSGNIIWAKRAGGPSNYTGESGAGIAIRNDTSIYLIGSALEGADFGSLTFHTPFYSTVFIAEFDSAGFFKRVVDVSNTDINGFGYGSGKRLLLNEMGEVYFRVRANYPFQPIGHYKIDGNVLVKLDTLFEVKWVKHNLDFRGGIYYRQGSLFCTGIVGSVTDTVDNIGITTNGLDIFTGKLNDAFNTISGTVFLDVDGDSAYSAADLPVVSDSVYLQQGDLFLVSDSLGFWQATVDTGTYTILNITPTGYAQIKPLSPDYYTVNFPVPNLVITSLDFGLVFATGIEDLQNEQTLKMYPNPLQTDCTFELPFRLVSAALAIYNAQGKEIYRTIFTGEKFGFTKGSLPAGIYYVKIADDARQFAKKIVVQ